jgi:hypothetical protein
VDVGMADEWNCRYWPTETRDMALLCFIALGVFNPENFKALQYTWRVKPSRRFLLLPEK